MLLDTNQAGSININMMMDIDYMVVNVALERKKVASCGAEI